VVASRSPGLVDSVQDGISGILVPLGAAAALAGAMRRVLDDAALRGRLEAGGRAWAATFTGDRCADEASAVLERALGGVAARAPGAAVRAAVGAF
jgi:D-inositol-3-phosphate glycosyltransferase